MAVLRGASDYLPLDPEKVRARERAFRRGFQHGAVAVAWALRDGASLTGIEHWIGQAVHEWRYHGNLEEDEHPPEPEVM